MSLSPLVSFKSRFVTYLLNSPRTMCVGGSISYCVNKLAGDVSTPSHYDLDIFPYHM